MLRLLPARLLVALFGWLNPETHREYKQLLAENRRLRQASPVSLQRMIRVADQGQVLYVAEKKSCRRFPKPASADLFGDVPRNFQVFDPLDFIAELTQHIPNARKHLTRSFGWYSNKSRGMRAKADGEHRHAAEIDQQHTPRPHLARRRWAALIQRVWAVDPLICARCRTPMKIISFIEPPQHDVIESAISRA